MNVAVDNDMESVIFGKSDSCTAVVSMKMNSIRADSNLLGAVLAVCVKLKATCDRVHKSVTGSMHVHGLSLYFNWKNSSATQNGPTTQNPSINFIVMITKVTYEMHK